MFLAARAVLLSMRANEDFGCAEKLSAAAVQKTTITKTYFRRRLSAVVSIFTDSAACVLSFYHSTPLHICFTTDMIFVTAVPVHLKGL